MGTRGRPTAQIVLSDGERETLERCCPAPRPARATPMSVTVLLWLSRAFLRVFVVPRLRGRAGPLVTSKRTPLASACFVL